MCQYNESTVKTARKDQKVYKVYIKYDDKYYSPIMGDVCELCIKYSMLDSLLEYGVITGSELTTQKQPGYHCFRSLKSVRLYRRLFHAESVRILQGKIPKGAKYREGKTNITYVNSKILNNYTAKTIRTTAIRLEKETL